MAESSEPEGGAFDTSNQVADRYLEGSALLRREVMVLRRAQSGFPV